MPTHDKPNRMRQALSAIRDAVEDAGGVSTQADMLTDAALLLEETWDDYLRLLREKQDALLAPYSAERAPEPVVSLPYGPERCSRHAGYGFTSDCQICNPVAPTSSGRLTKPAQVGNTIFDAGIEERLVIERAYRQHEYENTNEAKLARLERIKAFQQAVATPSAKPAINYAAGAEYQLAERVLKAWEACPVDDNGFGETVILARAYMAMVEATEGRDANG